VKRKTLWGRAFAAYRKDARPIAAWLAGYRAAQRDARKAMKRTQSTGHYGPKVGL
jgi:hypothetical protein